jgi:hypothetical protein
MIFNNDGGGRILCSYCKKNVRYDELRTKTVIEGRKKVSAIVQRCPECRRVISLDIPKPYLANKNE